MRRTDDPSARIQAAEHAFKLDELSLLHEVSFRDHEHVRELDLLYEQIGDGAFILRPEARADLVQALRFAIGIHEVRGVDERHHRVESCELRQARTVLVLEGEGLRYRQGLGDARRLYKQIVKATFPCETGNFFEQVFAQRAADTAVGHLDELFVYLTQIHPAGDQLGVDVDLAHVVDDHRNATTLAIGQHLIEQRGLSSPEEAGQHSDGKTFHWAARGNAGFRYNITSERVFLKRTGKTLHPQREMSWPEVFDDSLPDGCARSRLHSPPTSDALPITQPAEASMAGPAPSARFNTSR